MKIAVISSVYGSPWAGSEEFWYQTSLKCLQQGHQVFASLFQVNSYCEQLNNFKEKGGILNFRKRFSNGRRHVLKHKYLFSSFNKLFDWNPDTIILSLGCMTDLALYPDLLRQLNKQPAIKIIMITLFNSDNIVLNTITRQTLVTFCKKTSHFIFVSRHNYTLAERQLALKLNNVSVLSSPVSYLGEYKQLPRLADIENLNMACVARLDIINKGQDILLQALSNEKWKQRNWILNMYGKGEDEFYIKQLINFYKLEDKVRFCGFVTDTREIWSKNHLLVMASRSEGLSLAVLEAMICGRICVVTDVGGHGEVIQDSVSGFLAEAANPKYFEAALERAWLMRDQFNMITKNAHASALQIFKEKPVEKLMKIIFNN